MFAVPATGMRLPRAGDEEGGVPRLSVVIPCFNEERRLPATIEDVLAYLRRQPYASEVVIVDDGSTDGTAAFVRPRRSNAPTLRLVSHSPNRGKGYAVRRGLLEARGEVRLFMDADNSTRIAEVEGFWPCFAEGADVVIGSRAFAGARIEVRQSWPKVLAGRLGNRLIRALAVPGIRDTQAGFKAMTARVAEAVAPLLSVDGFGFDIELLALARREGLAIREVPIRWRNDFESKVRARDYVRVLGTVFRVRRTVARPRRTFEAALATRP